jgi:nicotinate-nucleotide adenylyltransferase
MAYDNQSIGLFGGSFNPAHAGHMHVAMTGLKALGLDRIWWMVSPQNPLKPAQPSYDSRVDTVLRLGLPPRMEISHAERDFGTRYTVDLLTRAQKTWPKTRFVFLMGADNFLQLPRWRSWRKIVETVPIAVIARPGKGHSAIRARIGTAAQMYRGARLPEPRAHTLQFANTPAWTYLTPPLNHLSSTQIRAAKS